MSLRYLAFVALIVPGLAISKTTFAECDCLIPEGGVFAEPEAPYYELALYRTLIKHPFRKVQMLSVPSFAPEEAVYLVREDKLEPRVIAAKAATSVWHELMTKLDSAASPGRAETNAERMERAFRTIQVQTIQHSATLDAATSDLLEEVWNAALEKMTTESNHFGFDGTRYFFSNYRPSQGFHAGVTWIPAKDTRMAALVHLGSKLSEFAKAPAEGSRFALKAELRKEAKSLLVRLRSKK